MKSFSCYYTKLDLKYYRLNRYWYWIIVQVWSIGNIANPAIDRQNESIPCILKMAGDCSRRCPSVVTDARDTNAAAEGINRASSYYIILHYIGIILSYFSDLKQRSSLVRLVSRWPALRRFFHNNNINYNTI